MSENQPLPVKQRMTPIDLKILTIRKRVKQTDVAKRAGVSACGVSRVFNGIEHVQEPLRMQTQSQLTRNPAIFGPWLNYLKQKPKKLGYHNLQQNEPIYKKFPSRSLLLPFQ